MSLTTTYIVIFPIFAQKLSLMILTESATLNYAMLWLCSPQASFVDGHALLVYGAFSIH